MKSIIFLAAWSIFALTSCSAGDGSKYQEGFQQAWWDTDDNNEYTESTAKRVPFPQCLVSGSNSRMFDSSSLQRLFDKKLREEEESLKYEGYENYKHHNDGTTDYDSTELRRGKTESHATARAAMKLTRDIMTILMCDLNGTDTANLNGVLSKFGLPKEFCSYLDKPDCTDRARYRTISGVCNNLLHPYEGSSQTAFGRYLPATYQDYLSEPRSKSCRGYGKLPGCRKISLALGSRPIFERSYNNFFVIFGQMIGHDVALSIPVSDTYSRPISSCQCNNKYDWDKCNVIDIEPDDPYLRGQKCMAFPATAQAFKNQICSLGVKEQMNGNTHGLDASTIYGSTTQTAQALRSENGRLKSTRLPWSKHELPPGQREGKSCVDGTHKRKCLTGGDSRAVIHLLFTGIHSVFLRLHNQIADDLHARFDWSSDQIYEEARRFTIALYQRMIYDLWLPILLGDATFTKEFGRTIPTIYKEDVPLVVTNEFATAVFRLHSLVRDLFSRCNYDGKRIDELWLHDILHKVKYAYDMENNGLDSILCGSFYDYGFAFDGNFAHQIHNRLFESNNQYGNTWRNDLVSINICRGREHGLPTYNDMRENCSLPRADTFEDFGDTINYDGIRKLKHLYAAPCDVDLYVGLNLEDRIPGGVVGPVSACIIIRQFKVLRDGDRFFFTHPDVFNQDELNAILNYDIHCLLCSTIHLKDIPKNPFKAVDEETNPLKACDQCKSFKVPDPKKT